MLKLMLLEIFALSSLLVPGNINRDFQSIGNADEHA